MEFLYPIISALNPATLDKELDSEDIKICGNILKTVQNIAILNKQVNIYLKDTNNSTECIMVASLRGSKYICITNDLRVLLIDNYDSYTKILSKRDIYITPINIYSTNYPILTIFKYSIISKLIELYNNDVLFDIDDRPLYVKELAQNICMILTFGLYSNKFISWVRSFYNFADGKLLHNSVRDKLTGFSIQIIKKSSEIINIFQKIDNTSVNKSKVDKLMSDISFQKTQNERLQFQLKSCESDNEKLYKKKDELKQELKNLKDKINELIEDKKRYEREHKRKHSEEKLDSIIDDLTESFRRNKMLEVKLLSTKTELEEIIYISENKTKEIYALKSTIKDLETKLKLKKSSHIEISDDISDISNNIKNKLSKQIEEDEMSLNGEQEELSEISKNKDSIESDSDEFYDDEESENDDINNESIDNEDDKKEKYSNDKNMDITQTEISKTEYSSMDIDRSSSISTFNKSVDMNKFVETKSIIDDDFIPLDDEEINYFLGIEDKIKKEIKDEINQKIKKENKSLTKKRKI